MAPGSHVMRPRAPRAECPHRPHSATTLLRERLDVVLGDLEALDRGLIEAVIVASTAFSRTQMIERAIRQACREADCPVPAALQREPLSLIQGGAS
jgi:hypothetical protein